MDPKANIAEQVRLAASILARLDADTDDFLERVHQFAADAGRLAELALALNEWRRYGGWDPYLRP